MNKISRFLLIALVIGLLFAFAGCGKEEAAPAEKAEAAPAVEKEEAPAVVETDPVEDGVMAYFANKPAHNYKIPQKDFVEKVAAGEDMYILDIRKAEDYEAGHIKGAVNAPWGASLGDAYSTIPSDKPLMIYCYSGQTAGQAVMLLNLAGFEAYSVNLGMKLGISKVEGVEAVMETTANEFPAGGASINPEILTAIKEYYAGLADASGTKYASYIISEDNVKELVDSEDPDHFILSIRKAEHYAEGHIATASNIPWGAGMEQSFSTLPKDKKIIVYCYTGQTAGQTVAGLRMLGYDAVSMKNGMGMAANAPGGWANKGFPVVK